MVDSSGPGTLRQCNTIALSDLGDTEGFGKPGTDGKLYALHLQENVYKRKEVTFTGNLGDLSDVDVSRLNKNTSYNLTRNDDKKMDYDRSINRVATEYRHYPTICDGG